MLLGMEKGKEVTISPFTLNGKSLIPLCDRQVGIIKNRNQRKETKHHK